MEDKKVFALQGGEYLAVSVLEITDIPSVALLAGDYPDNTSPYTEYRKDFGAMLGEVFQLYRTNHQQAIPCDLSAEILWLSEPVENQPFRANIRLFLVLRSVADEQGAT